MLSQPFVCDAMTLRKEALPPLHMKSQARGAKQVSHIHPAVWDEDLERVLGPWLPTDFSTTSLLLALDIFLIWTHLLRGPASVDRLHLLGIRDPDLDLLPQWLYFQRPGDSC